MCCQEKEAPYPNSPWLILELFLVSDSRQEALPHKHEPTVKTDSTWNTYSKSQFIILHYTSINKLFFIFICIL